MGATIAKAEEKKAAEKKKKADVKKEKATKNAAKAKKAKAANIEKAKKAKELKSKLLKKLDALHAKGAEKVKKLSKKEKHRKVKVAKVKAEIAVKAAKAKAEKAAKEKAAKTPGCRAGEAPLSGKEKGKLLMPPFKCSKSCRELKEKVQMQMDGVYSDGVVVGGKVSRVTKGCKEVKCPAKSTGLNIRSGCTCTKASGGGIIMATKSPPYYRIKNADGSITSRCEPSKGQLAKREKDKKENAKESNVKERTTKEKKTKAANKAQREGRVKRAAKLEKDSKESKKKHNYKLENADKAKERQTKANTCTVTTYQHSHYRGRVEHQQSYCSRHRIDVRFRQSGRRRGYEASSVKLSSGCRLVQLWDEDGNRYGYGDNVNIGASMAAFPYDLNDDTSGMSVWSKCRI